MKIDTSTATTQFDSGIGQVVARNNRFAFDLYGRLRGDAGNNYFSPYSHPADFSMIYAGAVGDPAGQIADVRHFTHLRDKLHPLSKS